MQSFYNIIQSQECFKIFPTIRHDLFMKTDELFTRNE